MNDFRNTYKKFFFTTGGNLNFDEIKIFASNENVVSKYNSFTDQYVDNDCDKDPESANEEQILEKIRKFYSIFIYNYVTL